MSKETDFKQRFVAVLQDLNEAGTRDPEAVGLIGTLAADIARPLKATSWSATKDALSPEGYDELLTSFRERGNALHKEGKIKQSYAVQALALSLVAKTQRADRDLATGEKLLDALIDAAMARARRTN
jgi:hypothetical protein